MAKRPHMTAEEYAQLIDTPVKGSKSEEMAQKRLVREHKDLWTELSELRVDLNKIAATLETLQRRWGAILPHIPAKPDAP
jgi:hypothetical protein